MRPLRTPMTQLFKLAVRMAAPCGLRKFLITPIRELPKLAQDACISLLRKWALSPNALNHSELLSLLERQLGRWVLAAARTPSQSYSFAWGIFLG